MLFPTLSRRWRVQTRGLRLADADAIRRRIRRQKSRVFGKKVLYARQEEEKRRRTKSRPATVAALCDPGNRALWQLGWRAAG